MCENTDDIVVPEDEQLITNPNHALVKNIFEFTARTIYGEKKRFTDYEGYTCLIVNVASKSKLADYNYALLNTLHDKYYDKGLRILAFPCNQFDDMEPGSKEDIIKYIEGKGVKFDVFVKVKVNGEQAFELFKYLKKGCPADKKWGNVITSNFTKFLTCRRGTVIERLEPIQKEEEICHKLDELLKPPTPEPEPVDLQNAVIPKEQRLEGKCNEVMHYF